MFNKRMVISTGLLTSTLLFCFSVPNFDTPSKAYKNGDKKVLNSHSSSGRFIQCFCQPHTIQILPLHEEYIWLKRIFKNLTSTGKNQHEEKCAKQTLVPSLIFFLYNEKYFWLKSFWERLPILNCGAAKIFTIFWDTLSKLGVTVEVRSFDGISGPDKTLKLNHYEFMSFRQGVPYLIRDAASLLMLFQRNVNVMAEHKSEFTT